MNRVQGLGRTIFVAVFMLIAGILDVIYGIAAIGKSAFFTSDAHYVFGNLSSWGWITLFIGVILLLAAFSLFGGGAFGRWIGLIGAALAAIDALLSIPGSPFWSLCMFALSLWIIHGLVLYGETSGAES